MSSKPAFLLIHGAWHNRETWDRVIPLLEAQGFVAKAIDLPGAGANAKAPASFSNRPLDTAAFATEPSPNAAVTQAERTAAVLTEVEVLGGDVVLVGHSLGGLTVTSVAEKAPGKLRAAVYLTAVLLPPGMPGVAMLQHETMAASLLPSLFMADPATIGATRIDTASADPAYRARVKQCFYGDVTDLDFDAFTKDLHCDEPFGVAIEPSPMTAERFGAMPRHFIRCLQDRAVTIQSQDFMIAAVDIAIGGKTSVQTLDSSHSPFLSQPEKLAAALIGTAG